MLQTHSTSPHRQHEEESTDRRCRHSGRWTRDCCLQPSKPKTVYTRLTHQTKRSVRHIGHTSSGKSNLQTSKRTECQTTSYPHSIDHTAFTEATTPKRWRLYCRKERDLHVATVKSSTPEDRDHQRDVDAVSWLVTRCHRNLQARTTTPEEEAPHTHPKLRTRNRISQKQRGSGRIQKPRHKKPSQETQTSLEPPRKRDNEEPRGRKSHLNSTRRRSHGRNPRSRKKLKANPATWKRERGSGPSANLYNTASVPTDLLQELQQRYILHQPPT